MRKVLLIALLVTAVIMFAESSPLGSTPVVVELFTSQGCSSCPPADALLRKIAADPALQGRVIPLAFHVDYWNHLGWRDPFSSRQWSERQSPYVRAMNAGALYRAIGEASRRKVSASVRAALNGTEMTIDAKTSIPNLEAIVLVVESTVTTKVERGENEGRTLTNARIVRQLVRAGRVDGKPLRARITPVKNGEIVVLLQDPSTLKIHAATVAGDS